tara:strand:- start:21 stop:647 length:627 start_codon:yes stop_codon:yes gene_type:complete
MQSEINNQYPLDDEINKQWCEERRLLNNNEAIEQEPMLSIQAKFFYLNTHQYIENIICEPIPLQKHENGSVLTKEKLIQIIQQRKVKTKDSKYQFLDLILCNFDASKTSIYSFSKTLDVRNIISNHVKKVDHLKDVFIRPSVFPFHPVNCLYFFFEEHELEEKPIILKSILKDTSKKPTKHTKKVRIILQPKKEVKPERKNKFTRKRK